MTADTGAMPSGWANPPDKCILYLSFGGFWPMQCRSEYDGDAAVVPRTTPGSPMELTHLTDYALRVLMYAGVHDERRVTMREIATAYDISLEHLRKVVHQLAALGYIETSRGRGGGLWLAQAPDRIGLGAIVNAFERSMGIVDCDRQPCALRGNCALKGAFEDARDAFMQRLDAYTLGDLITDARTRDRLHRLEQPVHGPRKGAIGSH